MSSYIRTRGHGRWKGGVGGEKCLSGRFFSLNELVVKFEIMANPTPHKQSLIRAALFVCVCAFISSFRLGN